MKALPFTIPTTDNQSFVIQIDKLEGFYPHLHRHEEIQICWIRKGQGNLLVQGEVFRFVPGDIFIIGSNKAHLFRNEMDCKGIESFSIFFDANPSKNKLMDLPEMKNFSKYFESLAPCNKIENPELEILKKYMLKIQKSSKVRKLDYFIRLLSILYKNLEIEHSPLSIYSEKDGDSMKYILWYALEHYSEDISLDDISGRIGYTPEAFCRFFKKRTGKTFVEFLNGIRISEACNKLISQENTAISKIAFESGFNNVSHFNRVFKQIKGYSPRTYKQNYESEMVSS